MKLLKFLIILYLVIFQTSPVQAEKNYRIVLEKLLCEFTDYCSANSTCSTRPIRRNVSIMNLYIMLLKEIRELSIRFIWHYKTNTYKPFLIDITVDFCKSIKDPKAANPLFPVLVNFTKNYTNSLHRCPLKLNEEVFVRNLELDASALPKSFPDGRYRVDLFFFDNKGGKNVTYWVSHVYYNVKNLKLNN